MSLKNEIAKAIQKADKSYFFEDYGKQAHAVLRELERKGYSIVPKMPTEEMIQAGSDAILPGKVRPEILVREVFGSMLKAAKG